MRDADASRQAEAGDVHVLVCLNSLELGGTQLNAIDHALTARRHGVHTTLVGDPRTLPASGPTLIDVAAARGVQVELLGGHHPGSTPRELDRLAGEVDADLVHAYSISTVFATRWGPCRFGKRPMVVTVYEMEVPSYVPSHPHLVVGTVYSAQEQPALRAGPVHLINPPVDTVGDHPGFDGSEFVSEHGLDPSHHRIVIVSRLTEYMKETAITHAVEAMAHLGRSDVDLIVVGTGDAEARLRARGEETNRRVGRDAVVFTGATGDPRGAYACADVVIGMGGSAARALAFGKPIVVSGGAGWYRMFTPETAEMLVASGFWSTDTDDAPVAGLTSLLDELLDDEHRRHELGRFGREFAVANYGLDAMTEQLVGIYRDAIADHVPASWWRDLPRDLRGLVPRGRDRLRPVVPAGVKTALRRVRSRTGRAR